MRIVRGFGATSGLLAEDWNPCHPLVGSMPSHTNAGGWDGMGWDGTLYLEELDVLRHKVGAVRELSEHLVALGS